MFKKETILKKAGPFLLLVLVLVLTSGAALAHSQNPDRSGRDGAGTDHTGQPHDRSHNPARDEAGLRDGHAPTHHDVDDSHDVNHEDDRDGDHDEMGEPDPAAQIFVAELSGSEMPVEPETASGDSEDADTEDGEPEEVEPAVGVAIFKLVTRQEVDEVSGERVDVPVLLYRLYVRNITDVTAAHIHVGLPGEDGEVVASLFAGAPAGEFNGLLAEGTITEADLVGMLSGDMPGLTDLLQSAGLYVNVHTVANPDGEIRGQITAQAH